MKPRIMQFVACKALVEHKRNQEKKKTVSVDRKKTEQPSPSAKKTTNWPTPRTHVNKLPNTSSEDKQLDKPGPSTAPT